MIKAVVFDLDGTILDTLEDLADTMNYCLNRYDMPSRNLNEIRSFVGNGIHKIIERSVPIGTDNKLIDKMFDLFNEHYKIHCKDKTKPYDGIVDLMQNLKDKNYKLAVVSNKADYAVKDLCSSFFNGLVDYAVGAKEGQRKKPYPDSVFVALEKLKISANEAIYIGDSEVDIETAKNANIDLIMVDWGFRNSDYLISLGAKTIIHKPIELIDLI